MTVKTTAIFVLILLADAVFAQSVDQPELLWRQVLGGAALTRPVEQAESVVLVCEGGTVKALGGSGALLWEYNAGGRLLPFIARSGSGASYVCRSDGVLHAINRAGRRLWRVSLRERLAAPPLIGWDDRVFVFLNRKLCCFTASGTRLWQIELESPLALDPVADRAGGFAGILENGNLIRVSAFGKMEVTRLSAVPSALVTLTQDGTPGGAASRFVAVHSDGRLELAGDWRQGDLAESAKLPASPVAVAERDGFLAALLANGELTLFSPERGPVWSVKTDFAKQGDGIELDWNGRGIYLLSKSGGEGFSLQGARRWNMKLSGSVTIPVLNGKGVMYSCGKDWILYAYRVEEDNGVISDDGTLGFASGGTYGLGEIPKAPNPPLRPVVSLNMVEAAIRSGNLGEKERVYTKLLFEITRGDALQGERNSFENTKLRVRALRLLGLIGSRETIPYLARLFRREQNLFVKAAAADAVGAIGVDPEGRALGVFAEAVTLPGAYLRERLLVSVAVSIGKLCRFSGPPLSSRGIPLLASLTDAARPKSVRARAVRELAALYTPAMIND
jgi:outer membrane protein assembly factor BamB